MYNQSEEEEGEKLNKLMTKYNDDNVKCSQKIH